MLQWLTALQGGLRPAAAFEPMAGSATRSERLQSFAVPAAAPRSFHGALKAVKQVMIQAVPQHVNCCKHNILVLRSESLHENLVFNFNQPRMKMDQQMGSCKQLHV